MTPYSPPPATASNRTKLPDPLPLVGRAPELASLETLMEGDGSQPRVLFVRGESGVGKSRLVSELADRARRRSWSVAHGRAYPVETGTPYAIFSDAWLPVLRDMDPSTLTVLSRGGEAELKLLFPALGEGKAPDRESSEPEEFRTRLMWSFAEFVKRLARRSPVLCILEDLQWADGSSLELLHFLARQAAGEQMVVVATYNDQVRDGSPHLIRTERSLSSIGVADVLRLEPLTRDQVSELVARTFSMEGGVVRDFAAVLYGWTRGNPFFVEEIVKSLVASGRVRHENGTWLGWDAKEFGMPGSIRDAILDRIRALSEDARTVVRMAAVIGSRAPYPLLAAVSGLKAANTLSAVEELCSQGLVEEQTEDGVVVYRFRHPLVRQTIYDELGLQRARQHHAVVADAMESLWRDEADQHADELAFHYARSDGDGLKEKATHYLIVAGRRALERRADGEAIDYLEAALERMGGSDTPDGTRASVMRQLARAHTHVGHFDEAGELLEACLDLIDESDEQHAGTWRRLGLIHLWRGQHDPAHVCFAQGLADAERSGNERGVVRLMVARAHALNEIGRGSEALAILDEALPIAERLAEPALLARVHRAIALLRVWLGPPEQAIEHTERAIALARQVGDASIEFWARWGRAALEGMRGNTQHLATAIVDLNAIADRARSPVLSLWTADLHVQLAHATGDWDAGIASGEKALALARSLHQRTLLPRLMVWISQFHVARNELDRAAELIDEAVRTSGIGDDSRAIDVHQVVPTYIGMAQYLVALGDYDEAIEAAEKGLEIAEGTGYVMWANSQLLPVLAEACLWTGKIDRAQEVGALMRENSTPIDHRLGLAWADACDSLVQWKRGDPAGAIDRMKAAADELEEIPMLWTATRLRRQLAGRMFETGAIDDGRAELDHVHEVCMRLRAGLELEKTRHMYRENGIRPPPSLSGDGPLGLTPAERTIALHVAEGMSNRAIAKTLGCAVRTVSTHLSNIYTKLDIGGPGARVRLGNLVRESGLDR